MSKTLSQLQLGFEYQLNGLTESKSSAMDDADFTLLFDVIADAQARLAQKAPRLPFWTQQCGEADESFVLHPYEILDTPGEVERDGERLLMGLWIGSGAEFTPAQMLALQNLCTEAVFEASSAAGVTWEFARARVYREYCVRSWETLAP